MSNEALQRIHILIQELSEKDETYRTQIDELAYLTDLCEDQLPSLFISLVRSADGGNFNTADKRLLASQRMEKSLQIARKYPKENQDAGIEQDLLPTFSLGAEDKGRIFKLCSDLRKIVFSSQIFDEPHKRRLLNRIASIENETHQDKGKLDVVLAGVVDVGDALGKFGTKIEPLTKRMKEIAQIARGGSKEYDQIPAPEEIQALPPPEQSDEQ